MIWPTPDPALVVWLAADAAQLQRGRATSVNKGAHGAGSPSTAGTACASCAGKTGITYDERQQGTLQLFRTQKQLDHVGEDIAILDEIGVPLRGARSPTAASRAEPALGAGARQVRGRPAPARRRDGRLLQVHAAPRGACRRRWASGSATARRSRDFAPRRGRITGVETDRGRADGRRLRGGAGQLLAAAC